ncbi:MAG: sulfatase-like hydrolase/transferase [Acidobacteriota bacterium]
MLAWRPPQPVAPVAILDPVMKVTIQQKEGKAHRGKKRGKQLASLVATGWLLAGPFSATAGQTASPARDLVLITVSSLRADRLRPAPSSRVPAPRLDSLAASGYLFPSARTPSPGTVPALMSLFTGLDPGDHRVYAPADPGTGAPSLPEWLGAAGYTRLAFVADPEVGAMAALKSAFDELHVHPGLPAPRLARLAMDRAAAVPSKANLFLWIHFNDPSAPYIPPVGDLVEFLADGWNAGWRFSLPVGAGEGRPNTLPPKAVNGPMREAAFYLDAYDATVRQADRGIGAVWDRLSSSPRGSRSLLVVASLHGEALGEHGLWFSHGRTLYEEEVTVPLLFHGPQVRVFREIPRTPPVSLMDVFRTCAALLQAGDLSEKVPGFNMAPRLRHKGPLPNRFLYAASLLPPFGRSLLVQGRFKVIRNALPPPGFEDDPAWVRPLQREFYDLLTDPLEANPRGGEFPKTARQVDFLLRDNYPPLPGTPPADDDSRRR